MENPITVMVVRTGRQPELREVPNELPELQKLVGGYIETVYLDDGVILVCNENGVLEGLPENRKVAGCAICGDFFLCREDGEEFASLTEEDADKYDKLLRCPQKLNLREENQKVIARIAKVAAYYLNACEDILSDLKPEEEDGGDVREMRTSMSRVKYNLQTMYHTAMRMPELFREMYGSALELTNLEILTDILDQERED